MVFIDGVFIAAVEQAHRWGAGSLTNLYNKRSRSFLTSVVLGVP